MDLPLLFRISFCVTTFLWAAYYFRRATKLGRYATFAFVVMTTYGFVIEYFDIKASHTYDYAKMLVMLGESPSWVPLSICLNWAIILFIATSLSDRLGLPWYQRPLLDGLVATVLDMAGDPVFSNTRYVTSFTSSCADATSQAFGGIGVWTWCILDVKEPLWFTVPLGNFFGWFLVVAVFSFLYRYSQLKLGAGQRAWYVQLLMLVLCAVLSAVCVEVGMWLYGHVRGQLSVAVLAATLLLPIALVIVQRRTLNFNNPWDLGLVFMPLMANVSDLILFFQRGIDRNLGYKWAAALVLVAIVSSCLTLLPFAGTITRRRAGAG